MLGEAKILKGERKSIVLKRMKKAVLSICLYGMAMIQTEF
jgi:hypothetical protein